MTKFLIGAATIALAAMPASAQLLGGGGGIAGGVAGGVGGGLGGIGGSASGTLSTMSRLPVNDVAAQARAQARQQARVERRLAARERRASLAGNATTSVDGASDIGGRSFASNGTAAGDVALGADASTLRTRGMIAATRSGLRRTGSTASGVAVFAPAASIAAPAVATGVAVRSYPAYSSGIYYGPNVVFVDRGEVGGYVERQYGDLSRDLRGSGATVIRRGEDLVVQFPADVTFAFNKADIRPQFYGVLNAFARSLEDYPASDVEVVGHTDAVGSDAYNLALSDRRGRSVADFLVARRTDPGRLVIEAMGESEPIDSNATVAGRAANRRVEFIIHPRVSQDVGNPSR